MRYDVGWSGFKHSKTGVERCDGGLTRFDSVSVGKLAVGLIEQATVAILRVWFWIVPSLKRSPGCAVACIVLP